MHILTPQVEIILATSSLSAVENPSKLAPRRTSIWSVVSYILPTTDIIIEGIEYIKIFFSISLDEINISFLLSFMNFSLFLLILILKYINDPIPPIKAPVNAQATPIFISLLKTFIAR